MPSKLHLDSDGSFVWTDVKLKALYLSTSEGAGVVEGTWQGTDDGDGSLMLAMTVGSVDGRKFASLFNVRCGGGLDIHGTQKLRVLYINNLALQIVPKF